MFIRLASLFTALFVVPALAIAQPARVVVADSNSPAAMFSARPANGNAFQILPEKAEIFSGDMIVSLPGGTITSKNGAVSLKALADFDGKSPVPILETAFSLTPSDREFDLDVSLDRGRINLTNMKAEGAANVRVRFWDQAWKITLDAPKTRVTLEICGRWLAGTRFKVADPKGDPKRDPVPVASLLFMVLGGTASVDIGGVTLAMKAPPGPAELRWSSLAGARPQAQKLDKFPEWADPDGILGDEGRKLALAFERFRRNRVDDAAMAFDKYLTSTEAVDQKIALITFGSLDDLDRLEKTLASPKSVEQWDFTIQVLRHWLGRAPGYDQRLYQHLTARSGYTDSQARIILQLLLGFTPDDVSVPETFEVLIDYLGHAKPLIRNLAAWHLVRLVPQGKMMIPFKPDATDAEAKKYQAAWRELLPNGMLAKPKKD